jgi:hypothetical protein
MKVKIQTGLARFLDSGQALCVYNLTSCRIHRQNFNPYSGVERFCPFFKTPDHLEEKGRTVLRGVGALSCFVNQGRWSLAEKHIWEDLLVATSQLLDQGVYGTTQQLRDRLPKFEAGYHPFDSTVAASQVY